MYPVGNRMAFLCYPSTILYFFLLSVILPLWLVTGFFFPLKMIDDLKAPNSGSRFLRDRLI